MSALEQPENFLPAEQGGAQVFGVVKVRLLQAPDARGQKAVGQVVGGACVARNVQEALPRAAAKARFFQQFAACGLLGRFALFADAGTKLVARVAQAVAVLAHHDELVVVGQGNGVHPVGVLQHVIVGDGVPVGQLYGVASDREPGAAEEVLAVEHFPAQVFLFVIFVHFSFSLELQAGLRQQFGEENEQSHAGGDEGPQQYGPGGQVLGAPDERVELRRNAVGQGFERRVERLAAQYAAHAHQYQGPFRSRAVEPPGHADSRQGHGQLDAGIVAPAQEPEPPEGVAKAAQTLAEGETFVVHGELR